MDSKSAGNIAPEADDIKDLYHAWVVVIAGFFLVLILFGTYYCFGVFLKPMLAELGWSRAMTTGAVTVYMVVHGVFAVIMGSLSDKFGPKSVVTISTLFVALGYGLISRITEPWHLYICFGFIVGIGMGASYVTPVSAVTKWFTDRRGLALGVVAAGVGAGQMILPPLVKYFITMFGWRTSFVITGAMIGCLGIPAALLLKNPPDNIDRPRDTEFHDDWSAREAVRTVSFTLLLSIFIALAFGLSIVTTHLVAHIEDMGFDPVPAAFVLTLIGGGGIFGRIMIGGSADKTGNKAVLVACLIPQALLLFCLIWVKELWAFYVIGALYGLTYGGTLPVIIKTTSEFFGLSSTGTIIGILILGATSGGAVGAPFAGYIYDVTGNYSIAFLIGGIVVMVGSVLSFRLKAPGKLSLV